MRYPRMNSLFVPVFIGVLLFLLTGVLADRQVYSAKGAHAQFSPPPQSVEYTGGRLFLTPAVNLHIEPFSDHEAVRDLTDFLLDRGFSINAQKDDSSINIEIGQYRSREQETGNLPPQGYTLRIGTFGARRAVISIRGQDSAGTFYGVQSLKQLLRSGVFSVPKLRIVDYPEISSRGVVEGFYGTPWTHRQRLDQLRFYGEHKLNTYIYAPKDDLYHRVKWREPYPLSEMTRMKELIDTAKANHVDFVFAVSPGIDIQFDGPGGEQDFAALLAKLSSLYDMGVRSFAIFYDDIEDKSGGKQAAVLNRIQAEFIQAKGDIKPLLTVPTEYYTFDMLDTAGNEKPYTKAFSKALAPEIAVMYTGVGVVCEGISPEELHMVNQLYNRRMAVWWNYPVTDYLTNKLALGPLYGLDRRLGSIVDELVMNPMEHAELSKLTLHTAAEYAWNPSGYDPNAALRRATQLLYGDLAEEMELFSLHSSRMENHWAHTGRPDAPALRREIDALWAGLSEGRECSAEVMALHESFNHMENAAVRLRNGLPPEILQECSEQLALFGQLAEFNRTALSMVEAKLCQDEELYQILRAQTLVHQTVIEAGKARISDETAFAFIAEALTFTGNK